jgi:hypothetical protein
MVVFLGETRAPKHLLCQMNRHTLSMPLFQPTASSVLGYTALNKIHFQFHLVEQGIILNKEVLAPQETGIYLSYTHPIPLSTENYTKFSNNPFLIYYKF